MDRKPLAPPSCRSSPPGMFRSSRKAWSSHSSTAASISSSRMPRLSRSNRKASSAGSTVRMSGPAQAKRSGSTRRGKHSPCWKKSASERWSRRTQVEAISLPGGYRLSDFRVAIRARRKRPSTRSPPALAPAGPAWTASTAPRAVMGSPRPKRPGHGFPHPGRRTRAPRPRAATRSSETSSRDSRARRARSGRFASVSRTKTTASRSVNTSRQPPWARSVSLRGEARSARIVCTCHLSSTACQRGLTLTTSRNSLSTSGPYTWVRPSMNIRYSG